VKESVEQAYVSYIYEAKEKCKAEKVELTYDKNKAYEIAHEYFFNSYAKPLFRRVNHLKINKLLRDELRFYRAKNTDSNKMALPIDIV